MRVGVPAAIVLAVLAACALRGAEPAAGGAPAPLSGWLSFGNGAARSSATRAALDISSLHAAAYHEIEGGETTQPLVVSNVPGRGQTTVYAATNAGRVLAYAPGGYVRWQRSLGSAPNPCPQLGSYGVTGTPVVDPATRALYVADSFGLLHALDLVTGAERPGWPVRLYGDPGAELVWGALADVGGSIYVGTGSFCDKPMVGKFLRVELATRHVSRFVVVPRSLGGGGGIWGWGGAAYSAAQDSLYVVTGNAFAGGSNTGAAFSESAGYGEQLVQLSRDLHVVAASHPATVTGDGDFDFAGSPIVFTPPGCGEAVAATNKNGRLFVWPAGDVAAGPLIDMRLQGQSADAAPLLTQPAYDAATRSIFLVTASALVRVALDGCTGAHVAWSQKLAVPTLHGSPTISGGTVWITVAGTPAHLRGFDTRTGARQADFPVGTMAFTPPTIWGGRLYSSAAEMFAVAHPAASRPQPTASPVRGHASWSSKRNGWESREDGVYATGNGGKTWRRIYAASALRVLQLTTSTGVISVGAPGRCACAQEQLWTGDGGRTWHVTKALFSEFAGSGRSIYTWSRDEVRRASWPPRQSTKVSSFPEDVADVATMPSGFVALLSASGKAWDNVVQVAVVRNDTVSPESLPSLAGQVTARALTVQWPRVDVRTYVYTDTGRRTVWWRSPDGGKTWHAR